MHSSDVPVVSGYLLPLNFHGPKDQVEADNEFPGLPMVILITGASGRVGRRTAELLVDGSNRLRLMSRNPRAVPQLAGADVLRGNFAEPSTLDRAFRGADVVFVISGSGKPGERALLHRNAFESAAKAHVGHVVYLSLQGAGPDSKFPYSRDHYLSEQHLAATGTSYTVLRAAYYIDMFLGKFDADGIVRGPANRGRAAFVSREDVACVAAAVLKAPRGGTYEITGPETLGVADVAGRLSVLVGRGLRYEQESVDQARERQSRFGLAPWQVDLAVGWFEAIAAGELDRVSDATLCFTGKEPLTMENYFSLFPNLLKPLRLSAEKA